MTTFFLVRHGANDLVGHAIAGRASGVHLNGQGQRQAEAVARRLCGARIKQIFSSPLERTMETAEPLARALGLQVQLSEAIMEIDFGAWTGKSIKELESDPAWRQWNSFRTNARVPGGESMIEVQARFVREMQRLQGQFPEGRIALFSHGDPIRSAVFYWLGISLEMVQRIEISPGSVTVIQVEDCWAQVQCVNQAC